MNSKKAGLAIIFALLATQLVLTYKGQAVSAEFIKQIDTNKAAIQYEKDKRTAAEKEAVEAKTKVENLTKKNSELQTSLDIRLLDQQKQEQEAGKIKVQLKAEELASAQKEQELISTRQKLSKVSELAQETTNQHKAREAILRSQIDELKKALEEKNQRLETVKKALDNTKNPEAPKATR